MRYILTIFLAVLLVVTSVSAVGVFDINLSSGDESVSFYDNLTLLAPSPFQFTVDYLLANSNTKDTLTINQRLNLNTSGQLSITQSGNVRLNVNQQGVGINQAIGQYDLSLKESLRVYSGANSFLTNSNSSGISNNTDGNTMSFTTGGATPTTPLQFTSNSAIVNSLVYVLANNLNVDSMTDANTLVDQKWLESQSFAQSIAPIDQSSGVNHFRDAKHMFNISAFDQSSIPQPFKNSTDLDYDSWTGLPEKKSGGETEHFFGGDGHQGTRIGGTTYDGFDTSKFQKLCFLTGFGANDLDTSGETVRCSVEGDLLIGRTSDGVGDDSNGKCAANCILIPVGQIPSHFEQQTP